MRIHLSQKSRLCGFGFEDSLAATRTSGGSLVSAVISELESVSSLNGGQRQEGHVSVFWSGHIEDFQDF